MPTPKFVQAIRQWTLNSISIRLRLALWYGTLLFVTLTLFSIIVFAVAQFQLETSVDQSLQTRAQLIARAIQGELIADRVSSSATPSVPPATGTEPVPTASVGVTVTPGVARQTPTPLPTPAPTVDPTQQAKIQRQLQFNKSTVNLLGSLGVTFEVLDANYTIVYKAPNIQGTLPPNPMALQEALNNGSCSAYDATQNPSGAQLRVYVYPVTLPITATNYNATPSTAAGSNCMSTTREQVVGAVVIAKTVGDVNGSLNTLGRLLILGVIIATIFTTMGSWFIAGSSLQPVSKVTRIARAIAINAHAAGLGRRVGYSGPRDEVGELAGTFDDMLASIEHVTNVQRRFVSDASHELRAPLTSIKSNLEFLRMARNAPEEARSEAVDDAYAEAERMTRLVNDLLLLARADAAAGGAPGSQAARLDDQMRGRREPVELDQLVMDIFRNARAQIQAGRKTRLQIGIQRLEPVIVLADPGQLRQVMMILLDNAIKYTPEGGRVRLSATRENGQAAINVSDTGIGIEPDVLPHIFQRFYRGDSARARDEHGSGLGLAIADWIVTAHNGEIRVVSEPGKGSTFSVLLPVLKRPGDLSMSSTSLPAVRAPKSGVVGAIAPFARLASSVSRPRTSGSKVAKKISRLNLSAKTPARTEGGSDKDRGHGRRERPTSR
jgi:two-component system OmpR family sensor kinase